MISIIIPVYNVEKYLDECLLSVFNQSYKDWECILINDGSTDKSGTICNKWHALDNRFIVIHQKNQGVSQARNIGLKQAKGKYICFVDSDDWIASNYLQCMINNMHDNIDIVVSGITSVKENKVVNILLPKQNNIYSMNQNSADRFIADIDLFYGPVSKLYKKEIIKINDITFPIDISLGEDMTFVFSYLSHVKKISSITESFYFYRKFDSGTLSTIKRKNIFDIYMRLWNLRVNFIHKKNMWNHNAEIYFARHLWGNIYDVLINNISPSYTLIKHVLNTIDSNLLKCHQNVFPCSKWLKYIIINKMSITLYLFTRIRKL